MTYDDDRIGREEAYWTAPKLFVLLGVVLALGMGVIITLANVRIT